MFNALKEYLTNAPVLVVPNPIGDFMVYINAFLEGMGEVLMQDGRVITCESRKLKDHELNYPTHDLELAVVVHELLRWRNFLLGYRLEMHNNHHSL